MSVLRRPWFIVGGAVVAGGFYYSATSRLQNSSESLKQRIDSTTRSLQHQNQLASQTSENRLQKAYANTQSHLSQSFSKLLAIKWNEELHNGFQIVYGIDYIGVAASSYDLVNRNLPEMWKNVVKGWGALRGGVEQVVHEAREEVQRRNEEERKK